MKEAANPKSAAMIAGAFVSILTGAITLVSVDDMAIGGVIVSILVLIGLGLLAGGLVVSWRTRKQTFEFREPTGRVSRIALRFIRVVVGLGLAGAGLFMIYLSFSMYARGEGFPVMGFIMGALIFLFGVYGFRSGLSREPIQPSQRNAGSRPSSDDSSASETPSSLGPRGWSLVDRRKKVHVAPAITTPPK